MRKEKRLDARTTAEEIARAVAVRGGCVYYVGGCVRDALLGRETTDIDIEVHGITPAVLEEILDGLGQRMEIGRQFGIYALRGCDLDIAMPRTERATGRGHRDFAVYVDPFAGIGNAARRRDFTVNAMMREVLTGELSDPYGGQEDLRRGILRHVSDDTFADDPLRVLRAAQFSARLGFAVDDETKALCRSMDLRPLARERVFDETRKALLTAPKPSVYFEFLRETDQLAIWFPELRDLIGVPQPVRYHAEGDVWVHTMMVLDAAATRRDSVPAPLPFMLAALTHDLGKAVSTAVIDGVLHAHGHETTGVPLAERFMHRLTDETALIRTVCNLVAYHMKPNRKAKAQASCRSTNRMFDACADCEALIALAMSDTAGKLPGMDAETAAQTEAFLRERLALYRETVQKPAVTGRDLIEAGFAPCAEFSDALRYAHTLCLSGVEYEEARRQTVAYLKKALSDAEKARKK